MQPEAQKPTPLKAGLPFSCSRKACELLSEKHLFIQRRSFCSKSLNTTAYVSVATAVTSSGAESIPRDG